MGSRQLRADLPFRRIAVVLSGGGAMGAYQVGVLKVLESVGVRPAILAGVSVGAMNAVIWLSHRCRTAALELIWSRLRSANVGMRWATLMMRGFGAFVAFVAFVQVFLTLAGSRVPSVFSVAFRRDPGRTELIATLLDVVAWLLVAVGGQAIVRSSRGAEDWMSRLTPPRDPQRLHRLFGVALIVMAAVHVATWIAGVPWPHRFSATLLLLGALIWFANRPDLAGDRLRRLFLGLLPETKGRGLWGSDARRRIIRQGMVAGDPAALMDPGTHLVITACAIDNGQMCHFLNWPDPAEAFRERVRDSVGEIMTLTRPEELVEAAVASSAIPVVFEPVRIRGRDFVDGGVFASQPLQAAIADGADAMIVVLVSPSEALSKVQRNPSMIDLTARLLEIAWWRDLQGELRRLPPEWGLESDSDGGPSWQRDALRTCVVEPRDFLPGGLYGISPAHSEELMALGAQDAWRALDAAGWLAPPTPAGQPPGEA